MLILNSEQGAVNYEALALQHAAFLIRYFKKHSKKLKSIYIPPWNNLLF